MKRIILAWILLTLSVIAACSAPPLSEPVPPADVRPENPAPEVLPPVEEPDMPSILDQREPVDDALFRIPNTYVEAGIQQSVRMFCGDLLIYGPRYQEDGTIANDLARVSLQTGEPVIRTTLQIPVDDVQVCGTHLVFTDRTMGTLRILDESLQEVRQIETGNIHCVLAVNSALTSVYSLTRDGGIQVLNPESGAITVLLEQAAHLYGTSQSGGVVSLSYTDRETQQQKVGILDLETGTARDIPFEGVYNSASYADGLWMAGSFEEDQVYAIGKGSTPYLFTLTEPYSTAFLMQETLQIMVRTHQEGSTALTMYGTDGQYLSRCTVPGTMTEALWSEADGGYYLISISEEGRDGLYFWDLSVPSSGDNLPMEPVREAALSCGAVSQSLYDRAAELSQTYGVSVRIAEQITEDNQTFTTVSEMDENLISDGLDAVEQVLSGLPEGLLPQLCYGTIRELQIHLTGAVSKREQPEQVSGFSHFSGFTEVGQTSVVVAVDLTYPGSLAQTLCHELAHVIDGKLAFDANLRENAVYSEATWMQYNPAGFAYAETYDEMPLSYFSDSYEAWFIDLYSRTYAKEDRARILEHAMMGNSWAFRTDQRMAKLEYLQCCIEDCFGSSGWPMNRVI